MIGTPQLFIFYPLLPCGLVRDQFIDAVVHTWEDIRYAFEKWSRKDVDEADLRLAHLDHIVPLWRATEKRRWDIQFLFHVPLITEFISQDAGPFSGDWEFSRLT